ncbi:MAG: DNA-binding protein [Candidatus Marinimicrobia bacterium]|nr:DNA-binding protein [Candidatus Neomarinimicrobiota bacterium]
MSTNRLGKGLEALIRSKEEQFNEKNNDGKNSSSNILEIDLKNIFTNPNQPRKIFKESSIEHLKESISSKGVLSPITVREVGEKFEVIAGERRFRASKASGKKTIPAYIIKVQNDSDMLELALIENIQRENLNPIEEAKAYEKLSLKFKMSHSKIAASVGKSRVYVTNMIRLLKLPDKILQSLIKNEITSGHARAILQLKMPNLMLRLWKRILADSLSVRASETLVKEFVFETSIIKPKLKPPNRQKIKEDNHLENDLIEIFGTKVKLKKLKRGGTIEISFFSSDDLNRILDLLESIKK